MKKSITLPSGRKGGALGKSGLGKKAEKGNDKTPNAKDDKKNLPKLGIKDKIKK